MYEIKSQEQLYQILIPAFKVKLRLLKNDNYNSITKKDIWNYLKENKWCKSIDLSLSEMVNDIIHAYNKEIDLYKKKNIEGINS
jgi:hypothetical protein